MEIEASEAIYSEIMEDDYEAMNMTIPDMCHTYNATILEALNLTEICANRPALPTIFVTFVQVFYALVCLVGLCGNTLVIYVVLRYSKMQTVTYIYILMLAIADEIFLLGIPFLITTMVKSNWIFGFSMCKIYYTTTSINQFTSSIFLTVLSADRYIAVCHPISAPKFRSNVIARCVSLTAWAVSALLMMPVFMYAATLTTSDGGTTCNIFWPSDEEEPYSMANATQAELEAYVPPVVRGQQIFTIYTFILGFAIPLCLILVFYAQVVYKLRTVGPKSNSAAVNGKSKARKKSHAKVTRLVLTVITVYIFCWFPYWITQLALIFATRKNVDDEIIIVAVNLLVGCLSYSNSAVNPVLYAFLSENFKKSFMKACTCANRGEANAALQVEHSLFPRKRTLLGRAKGQDRNAVRNKLLAQAKEPKLHHDGHHQTQALGDKMNNHPDMIHVADSRMEANQEANDVSTGVSMSRTSRSCFNSTAGPTGITTVPNSANVSIAQPESAADEASTIRVINGNLAPPTRFNRSSSPPQSPPDA